MYYLLVIIFQAGGLESLISPQLLSQLLAITTAVTYLLLTTTTIIAYNQKYVCDMGLPYTLRITYYLPVQSFTPLHGCPVVRGLWKV